MCDPTVALSLAPYSINKSVRKKFTAKPRKLAAKAQDQRPDEQRAFSGRAKTQLTTGQLPRRAAGSQNRLLGS